jgi:hypothetical protein
MIGFQRGINLIFSLFKEGDNNVSSPLRSEKDLNSKKNLYNTYNFNLLRRRKYDKNAILNRNKCI